MLHNNFGCQYCADFLLYRFRNMLNKEEIGNNRLKVEKTSVSKERTIYSLCELSLAAFKACNIRSVSPSSEWWVINFNHIIGMFAAAVFAIVIENSIPSRCIVALICFAIYSVKSYFLSIWTNSCFNEMLLIAEMSDILYFISFPRVILPLFLYFNDRMIYRWKTNLISWQPLPTSINNETNWYGKS